jgi:thiol-disulfide isomerase/thioredoxin
MLAVDAGPFVVPTSVLAVGVGGLVALAIGRWAGWRQRVGIAAVLADMLLAAIVAARLVFVGRWFDHYLASPWAAFDLRDGGFSVPAGVIAGLAVAAWHAWRRQLLRTPLLLGLLAGAFGWAMTPGAFHFGDGPSLGALAGPSLTALDGAPARLDTLTAGKPTVVNLWATWCPPCRREMPVLAAAQHVRHDLAIVFANQGEDRAAVEAYLGGAGLALDNVLLDPQRTLGAKVGSSGLPTTLFFDVTGRLVATHIGALSSASLASQLARLGGAPASASAPGS